MSTETPVAPAAPTETAPKGPGALLKDVQSESNGKTSPKGTAPAKGKGGKKKGEAAAAPAETPKDPQTVVTLDPFNLPPGREEDVPRKEIILERRLQHRKDLQDDKEGGAVDHYAERMKSGAVFPRSKGVRNIHNPKEVWVFDGFQRQGAYDKNKVKETPMLVWDGTFADALLLSLRSNDENSVLPRTKDDATRSVLSLMDSPELLADCFARAKGEGGFHRTAAELCGVSVGTVAHALELRQVKPSKGKLVPNTGTKKKTEPKADPKADPALAISRTSAQPAATPAQQRKVDTDAFEALRANAPENLIAEASKCVKRVAAIFAALVMDETHGKVIRDALKSAGVPLDLKGFEKEAKDEGKNFSPWFAMLQYWTTGDELCNALKEVGEAVKDAEATAKDEAAKAQAAAQPAAKK